jgi:AAA domain
MATTLGGDPFAAIGQGADGMLRQEPESASRRTAEQPRHPNAPQPKTEPLKPDFSKAILKGAEWLKRELDAPVLVLGEWLSTTSRVMLYAPTGIGKSMIGIAIGMRVAAGDRFLHWKAHKPKRVLYIDGEMSRILLKERIAGEAERLGGMPETFFALFFTTGHRGGPENDRRHHRTGRRDRPGDLR